MKTQLLTTATLALAIAFFGQPVSGQTADGSATSTPPLSTDEKQAAYNATLETRTDNILKALALTDADKSNRVHDIIFTHYHALRARDEAINDELSDLPKGSDEWRTQRDVILLAMSQAFHQRFISALSKELTPEQLATVKDQMTYGKVQFTYNAYCSILPDLTDEERTNILNTLVEAREVAMEGGSSGEKSDIFQHYKEQINSYLGTNGIDVAKATAEWSSRQKVSQDTTGQTNSVPKMN